jgi:Pentapeptide repeats (8 copies)
LRHHLKERSMQVYLRTEKPTPWKEWRTRVRHAWVLPFAAIEYVMEYIAYALSNWRFLEVLEYLSRFGVLVAVIFYFSESGDRLKQKHYQAWQVINSAQGKGGNGGRIDALEELNADGVSLVGVNLASAFLMGAHLPKAKLARANFDAADARNADLRGANIVNASLRSANFRDAHLQETSFAGSVLDEADLTAANLTGADLTGASLEDTDLRNANLQGTKWNSLQSVKNANVFGVNNPAFVDWALAHGAISKVEDQ